LAACSTNISVDSANYPVASYDNVTGVFEGKVSSDIKSVFNATNIALQKDLGYFRVGQSQTNVGWVIYARAELDFEIIVTLTKAKGGDIVISIEYGDGDLMKSQEIFNTIVKELRSRSRA